MAGFLYIVIIIGHRMIYDQSDEHLWPSCDLPAKNIRGMISQPLGIYEISHQGHFRSLGVSFMGKIHKDPPALKRHQGPEEDLPLDFSQIPIFET